MIVKEFKDIDELNKFLEKDIIVIDIKITSGIDYCKTNSDGVQTKYLNAPYSTHTFILLYEEGSKIRLTPIEPKCNETLEWSTMPLYKKQKGVIKLSPGK